MALFRCTSGTTSGGSAYTDTTEQVDRNTDLVIPTGLTTITRFIWYAECKYANYADKIHFVLYDSAIHPNGYDAGWNYDNCYGVTNGSFNQNHDSTAKIVSISGGTVTLHTYNNSICQFKAGKWFAEGT